MNVDRVQPGYGQDAFNQMGRLAAQLETAMPWRDKQLSLIRKLED
jgi:hypothetical protein